MKQINMRGRIALICAISMMIVLLIPFPAAAKGSEEYIKVGLKYGSSAVKECVLKSESGFQIVNITDNGPEDTLPLPAYTEITAVPEGGKVMLYDEDGTLLVNDMGSTGAVMPMDYEDGDSFLTVDGKNYRDGIWFTVQGGSSLNVINYITMNHYLYGVIHSEMSQSYPIEALKAQAVVARSFAGQNQHAHRDYGFDVCAGTHCQVYSGMSVEYPKTTQAVDETDGEMLYAGGRVVQAYYFKNSGGHTQNSEDVWSAAESYLRGVSDPYSPDYSWSAEMTFEELARTLSAAGYQTGTVESVSVTKRNSAGAVAELTVKGNSGTAVLKKERVRTALGGSKIKSTMFDLAGASNNSGQNTAQQTGRELYITNGSAIQKLSEKPYILAASGSTAAMQSGALNIQGASQTVTAEASGKENSGSNAQGTSETVTAAAGGSVIFNGKGYGHGIGMPQDSAIKMAQEGFSYRDILEFYFTGIEIHD